MDAVIRGLAVYLFLLIVFRISGKRTLAEISTFDFVLILIIAESTQQALLGPDFSLTNAFLLIVTLVGLDIGFSWLKEHWSWLARASEGKAVVILEDGQLLRDRMSKVRVDECDILEAARRLQGLERLDQIKYAVLEKSGGITIIAKQ